VCSHTDATLRHAVSLSIALPRSLSHSPALFSPQVLLGPGESKQLEIELDASDLAYWDDGMNGTPGFPPGKGGWRVDPGAFDLFAGTMKLKKLTLKLILLVVLTLFAQLKGLNVSMHMSEHFIFTLESFQMAIG